MKRIIVLKGLPASGKSTWAKQQLDKWPGQYTRVNKDDLRAMLHNGRWSKRNEKQVLVIRDDIVMDALRRGQHVIIDDTNLHDSHYKRMQEIAKLDEFKGSVTVEEKFFEISLEEAIERDLKRPVSVGERVIRGMYKEFLAAKPVVYVSPVGKPLAVICDIDGTLAKMEDRGPFEWHKVGGDSVNVTVRRLLDLIPESTKIILVSGRDEVCRPETEAWLDKYNVRYEQLFMRPEGDMRKDTLIKREIFDNHLKDDYRIEFVLDDRNQVVEMWRNLGLVVLQVAEGDF